MEKALTVPNKALHPPRRALPALPPIVFAKLYYVLLKEKENSMPVYMIYGMSAYCRTILVLPVLRLFQKPNQT